jgi:hypothetical protein
MDFKYRYDLLVTFNHKIAEHFYSGDDFIGGINEETVKEVFDNQEEDGFTFFPDLMNDIDSLFGEEEFETTRCDISAKEITFYYSTHETGIQNFEKKCLGWVMLKELDNAFCYYCIIDFDKKDFIIRDGKGGERRDKLKTIKIKNSQLLN